MALSINPLDRSFVQDPYPVYQRLREEAPVYWHELTGYWWLTRYEDVWNALRDPRFSSARTDVLLRGIPSSDVETPRFLRSLLEQRLLFTDGTQHARLRSLLNHAFTPRQMERMRPIVRATIREQLAPLQGRNQVEVISELADPLPSRMICRIIGLPADRFDDFKKWTNDIYAFFGLAQGGLGDRARAAAIAGRAAVHFLQQLIDERRRSPADDLLSALIQAEEAGEKLTAHEIIFNIIGLLNAGHETTTNLLGNGLYLLLKHPDVLRAVRHDQNLLTAAIEESSRLESAVQMPGRILTEPVTLHGTELPAGANVLLLLGSANRDPRAFPDPDTLNLERQGSRPVTFGYGPHFCIGAALARMIAEEFFVSILTEWKTIELASPIEWRPYPVFRGLSSLIVRVDPSDKDPMAILKLPLDELSRRIDAELQTPPSM